MLHLVEQAGLAHAFEIDSAGTIGHHLGEPADRRTQAVAKRRGVVLPSRARRFHPDDFERFDLVLAMDLENRAALLRIAPDEAARAKVALLRSFDGSAELDAAVPDPYYGGPDGFEEVFDICERACRGLLEHLRTAHGL